MSGIYRITAGQWDANGELVEDDTDYYTHQGIDGKEVQTCDTIEIPVVGVGDQVPPPGTITYLLGILGVPDGIYRITDSSQEE